MRKIIFTVAVLGWMLPSVSEVNYREVKVTGAPFEMPVIREPVFPARDFLITSYGAKPDGRNCGRAIAAAMAACEAAGGGRVVVPAGEWTTGAVHLRSNCNFHLAEGAVVSFTDDPADYPVVHTTWEGIECLNYSPLMYAYGCTNVAVTGPGLLAPKMAFWRTWFGRPDSHIAATGHLYHWGATNAVMAARDLTKLPDSHMRPHLLQINRCTNVLLDGFRTKESPFWMIHLYHSESCIVRNLDTYAHGHNNDGVDVDMTRNVLIENCRFDQGDDGVVLKAGRNQDAWRLARPTENVVLRNCTFAFAGSLLAIGSELSGGVRNVWVKGCSICTPYNNLRIKTNRRRGGFVENVWVEDVQAEAIRGSILNVTTKYYYQWAVFPDYELRYTPVKNINISNVRARCADWAFNIEADENCPADGFRFRNIRLESARKGFAHIVNAKNIEMNEVSLGDGPLVAAKRLTDWVPTGAPNQANAVPESEKKSASSSARR
jgi:polygalacturonase